MPEWLLVVLFISVGFILFLIELFTPGFGLTGISGLISIAVGSYIAYTKLNLFWGLISTTISLLGIIGFFKVFTKTGIWKRLRLETTEDKGKGFRTGRNLEKFLNKEGLALSPLRPTGTALIDGKRIDVVAEGLYIDKGKNIRVVRIEGNNLIVREK